MWQKGLFQKKNSEKNILVLGEAGCGKKSFVLYYKDGLDITGSASLPEFNKLIYNKKLDRSEERISLVFTLNGASDEMIPSISKSPRFDLILILIDLSSETAKADLQFYRKYAKIHFPEVKTLLVGTKQDKQLEENVFDKLINSSAKTGKGFDQFEEQLMMGLELNNGDKKGLSI
ncbi:TPA: hypothetical protein JBA93_13555 [Legionella pneumophila subsp. pneumophila]|nr:hypothetical protein [Legionella pneumophila]HAT8967697.1 hypothetical protein [Legionella pneumophila subsp. pneumophila]